jgi:hypothetical protein
MLHHVAHSPPLAADDENKFALQLFFTALLWSIPFPSLHRPCSRALHMELSKATLELLRDEAYVFLCREIIEESVKALARQKAQVVSSRPPFGVLAKKKTREAFESSRRSADDTEATLRQRLAQAARYETWLQRCISRELAPFLEAISPEYQRVSEIKGWLDEWEKCVTRQLPALLTAFSREMRGLRGLLSTEGRTELAVSEELALLRDIALRVEQQQDYLTNVANRVNAHAMEIGLLEVRVPPLPQFRRRVWVDALASSELSLAILELNRAEMELRAFLNGMQPIIGRLQAGRVSCVQRHEDYLRQYWDQLRAHAQGHWVEERDVDEVLETMAARYDRNIKRHQREVTHNPFSRVAESDV